MFWTAQGVGHGVAKILLSPTANFQNKKLKIVNSKSKKSSNKTFQNWKTNPW